MAEGFLGPLVGNQQIRVFRLADPCPAGTNQLISGVCFVTKWGGVVGTAEGQFAGFLTGGGPHYISVDSLGDLYVSDRGNHRIQKFTFANPCPAGTTQVVTGVCFVVMWGWGVKDGSNAFQTCTMHLCEILGIMRSSWAGDLDAWISTPIECQTTPRPPTRRTHPSRSPRALASPVGLGLCQSVLLAASRPEFRLLLAHGQVGRAPLPDRRTGRFGRCCPHRVQPAVRQQLAQALQAQPQSSGLPGYRWTAGRVRRYLARQPIRVSLTTAWRERAT